MQTTHLLMIINDEGGKREKEQRRSSDLVGGYAKVEVDLQELLAFDLQNHVDPFRVDRFSL